MKINFVIPSTVLGGGIRVIFIYANYLVEKGHDVVVYVPMLFKWDDIPKLNIKTSLANTFKRGKKVSWFDCHFKIALAWRISDKYIRDADITVASAWFTARNVYNLSPSKGQKVYFVQDYEIWHQDKSCVDASYKLNMHKIAITNNLRDTLQKECGVDATVVYNGHNQSEFISGVKKLNEPRTIIMLGNFSDYKGGSIGLNILKNIHKKYGVKVIIFGVNNVKNLPDFVEFYQQPRRDLLMSLYRKADICLFPSMQEAWGLTAIEAMANKTAVVGFNTGCLKEIATNEVNAVIVNDFKQDTLQLELEKLILDECKLKRIQNAGYDLVKNITWSKQADKFESVLLKIKNK